MELTKSRTVFLALTGLEEFWDKSQPMLLLGQWCKSYEKLLPKLANWLNQIHGSHHSLKHCNKLVFIMIRQNQQQ